IPNNSRRAPAGTPPAACRWSNDRPASFLPRNDGRLVAEPAAGGAAAVALRRRRAAMIALPWCDLAIRIGRRERLRLPVSIDDLPVLGDRLAEQMPILTQHGRVAVIVDTADGISHIVHIRGSAR